MKKIKTSSIPLLKKITASIILAGILPMSAMTPAQASLSDELDGMFSNVTAPGSFNTTLRDGWSGGGVGIRVPIRNISIISFDPPRLSAGCGGIDFFGGSFSFINSDQLIALLRAIAANAIGVAFKAAIDAINPQLGKIMGDFQQIVQNLNQGLSNTCALANTIVSSAVGYLGQTEIAKGSIMGEDTAVGKAIDSLASFTGSVSSATESWFANSGSKTRKAAGEEKQQDVGNIVWKALGKSGVANNIGNPITGETSQKAGKEFIMSMLGTIVIGSGDQGKTTGEDSYSGNDAPAPTSQSSWTISMKQLRDGPQNDQNKKLQVLKCSATSDAENGSDVPDGPCNIVTKVDAPATFVGIQGYVNQMFFGAPDGKPTGATATSIIGKIQYCASAAGNTGCNFTAQQKQFLQSIDGPVLGMLKKVQHDRTAMSQVASIVAPIIAIRLSISYANMALQTAAQAFDGQNQPPMPDTVKQQVRNIHEYLEEADKEDRKMWDDYQKGNAYIADVIKNSPELFAAPVSR